MDLNFKMLQIIAATAHTTHQLSSTLICSVLINGKWSQEERGGGGGYSHLVTRVFRLITSLWNTVCYAGNPRYRLLHYAWIPRLISRFSFVFSSPKKQLYFSACVLMLISSRYVVNDTWSTLCDVVSLIFLAKRILTGPQCQMPV